MLKGIGVTERIAIGNAVILQNSDTHLSQYQKSTVETEINKLKNAIEKSRNQIMDIIKQADEESSGILSIQLDFLDDPTFNEEAFKLINNNDLSALESIKMQTQSLFDTFMGYVDDPYFQERSSDIKDVGNRITSNLLGTKQVDLSKLPAGSIIVSRDLVPSQTAQLDKDKVSGFLIEVGGKTSHTAIMARSMGIAAVVGCAEALSVIKDNDRLIVDGISGDIIINPDADTEKRYTDNLELLYKRHQSADDNKNARLYLQDSMRVLVSANIGSLDEARLAKNNGADGIGLFRTEFLYLDRETMPSEDEQFESYKQVLEIFKDKPVIIRTLDIGGDKFLPYFELPKEENPFLGVRAIRLCLQNKDIFNQQLRALLRAGLYGDLKIMFPMIGSLQELRQAKKCIETAKEQLTDKNVPFSTDVEVGMMIEIPSAALIADTLADEVDFFSIGTNDLTQYALAVDRGNTELSALYDDMHPGVLRLIEMTIKAARAKGIFCGMCGELAGNEKALPTLVKYHLEEFSVGIGEIGRIKTLLLEQNEIRASE